jgi:hypothetical protein
MPAISDLLLEQYVLGELTPEMEEKVREEMDRDPQLRARYEAIRVSDKEILERYPPAVMARAIDDKQRGMTSSMQPAGRWALQLALGLPAAALVLIVFSFFVIRDRVSPDIRVKGLAPHLNAFLKTSHGPRELEPGSLVGRGDVIQLSYTAAEAKYGAILWVDGRGAITWLLPSGYKGAPGNAPALDRQGQVILPNAYELDDAPGFERFFLVYAEKPFDIAVVAEAARALSKRAGSSENVDLPLPAGVKQSSLLLKKRGPAP